MQCMLGYRYGQDHDSKLNHGDQETAIADHIYTSAYKKEHTDHRYWQQHNAASKP